MRSALTAVELMVSMALGLVVAATAFAGFRIASISFSAAQAMSRENILLADGYLNGVNEADFWYALDDPFETTGRDQRTIRRLDGSTGTLGAEDAFGAPFVPIDLPDEFWNWRVMDPKTWVRMGFLKTNRHGSSAQLSGVNHPHADAAWLPTVQDRCFHHLGIAGMSDFLPNHLPWGWYLAPSRTNSFGVVLSAPDNIPASPGIASFPRAAADYPAISKVLHDALLPGPSWTIGEQSVDHNGGRSSALHRSGRLVMAPRRGWTFDLAAPDVAPLTAARGIRSYQLSGPEHRQRAGSLLATPPTTRLSGEGWPDVTVGILREQTSLSPWRAIVLVRVTNPVNGSQRSLAFTPMTTTLRGARQQRQWAHWRQPGDIPLDR